MNKMKPRASQRNMFLRIITTPLRALCKARDYYVKSMTSYAERMNYGNVMALPGSSQVHGLPKSFSVNSARSHDNEDFRELLRAASARTIGTRADLDPYARQQMTMRAGSGSKSAAGQLRSRSVAMGKIDENSPCCYFGEDHINNGNNDLKYPRSKSHSVTRKVF